MLHKDHLCWKQMVQHEKRDAKNFNNKHKDTVFNMDELNKRLDQVQSVKAK